MKNQSRPRQLFLEIALVTGLAAAYFVAAKLGLRLAFVNASATAVWPATGIALAAFLFLGRRAAPGIWLGAFLANLTTAGSVATSLAIATGNTLEGLIGAYLVNRFAHGLEVFERATDIFKWVALAALGSTLVSATVGVSSLALAGFARWADYGSVWLTWWLGDAVGAIVVTPVLILWFLNPRVRWDRRRAFEFSLLLGSLLLAGLLVFSGWSIIFGIKNYPLQFLCIPLFVWAAFRFGSREVAGLILILSGLAIWGTLNGFGPFLEDSQNESLLLLQAFIGVVTVTTLILAAVVTERNRLLEAVRASNAELVIYIRERTGQLEVANRGLHREISERRRTETFRWESEQLLRLLVEGVKDYAIFLLDPQGRIISWNAGAKRLKGYSAEEVIGQPLSIFYTPQDIAAGKPQQLLNQATNEGPVEDEGWRVRKDGTRFWADALLTALRDSQEQLRGFAKITRDMTERRQAQEALQRQTRLYESLLKAQSDLGDGLAITEGPRIVYANEALSQIYGYSPEALLALPSFLEVVAPEERGPLGERLTQRLRGESLSDRGETVVIHKEGHRVYIEYAVKLIQVDGKHQLFSIIRDITRRKLIEDTLRRREAEFRTLTENSPDIIARFDRQGRRIYVNPTIQEKTGIPWQSFIGKTTREVGIAEDFSRQADERLRRVFETGQTITVETEFPTPQGPGHFETRLIPERGPDGSIETVLGVTRDITQRKRSEAALQQANTRLTEMVAELESFSYSVSHDLRAPLRVMQGFASTLLEDYADRLDASGVDFARRIVEAAQHMDHLIRDLLTYSRLNQTGLNLEPIELTRVVAEAVADLKAEIEERQAQVTVAGPLPRAIGHHGILVQVIQNVLSNAIKFVPPEVPPQVQVWAEENPFGIRLWVKDNGLGIALEHRERIFRIFERLHNSKTYPGTGVGLALVHKGMERLGGRVGVESELGHGSRFWLELPRVKEE